MYELLVFKIGELRTSTADIDRHGISVADCVSDCVISVVGLFFTSDDLEFHAHFRLDPLKYLVDVHRLPDSCCGNRIRSEEHTSELQSRFDLVCRLLLVKKS